MALYDENGKIIIDETAAQNDVKKLNAINDKLLQMITNVQNMKQLSQEFEGDFLVSLFTSLDTLEKNITRLSEATDKTCRAIDKTVLKYRKIDESMKNIINTTL